MREKLVKMFPKLKNDIFEFWEEELRNAFLLGAFDRVYGPQHPRRAEFIALLEEEPDSWSQRLGVSSVRVADPQQNN